MSDGEGQKKTPADAGAPGGGVGGLGDVMPGLESAPRLFSSGGALERLTRGAADWTLEDEVRLAGAVEPMHRAAGVGELLLDWLTVAVASEYQCGHM